jgi:hypothetical protein
MSRCAKKRYSDKGTAFLALDTIQRKWDGAAVQKVEQRAYKCPQCRGWHLTSSVSRRTRKAA